MTSNIAPKVQKSEEAWRAQLTPEQYREKWGLDPNYPMVAPSYAVARSQLAKKMGLGRKRKGK